MSGADELRGENVDLMGLVAAGDFDGAAAIFAALVVEAGAIVMEIFAAPKIDPRFKDDRSPVCEADERAEAFLLKQLRRLAPELPAIAEESAAKGRVPKAEDAFLLVDPLDATREFVEHSKEFTINIGLVVHGTPRAGAIFAPALERLWFGGTHAYTAHVLPGAPPPPRAQWREIRCREGAPDGLVALASRSHLDEKTRAFLSRPEIRETRKQASSLKFCELAEGRADVYPRFSPTMEWDTAAGDAILRAAGGVVLTPRNEAFFYGKSVQGYQNGAFIAWADPKRATNS